MTFRYAVWAAVSSKEQAAADKTSIPNQLKRTRDEAERRGWAETAGPFVVKGASREIYIDLADAEREIPALHAMLTAARSGQFDILVCTELDRFRSLQTAIFRTLGRFGIQLFALNAAIEPVPPAEYSLYKADSALMMTTLSQLASSMEIARTRRKHAEGMPSRIRNLGLPAQIPYGYRKPPGSEADRRAVPVQDPETARYVLEMKDALLSGQSCRQIAADLNTRRIPAPRGGRWNPQTVRELLRNRFFAGFVTFGASRVVVDPRTNKRKRARRLPDDQQTAAAGKHAPLWDEATHRRILGELYARRKSYGGRRNSQFTSLLTCGVCGAPLWRQGNGPRGGDRRIWRCSSTGSAAGHVNVPHDVLVRRVGAALSARLKDQLRRPARRAVSTATEDAAHDLATLEKKLARLEQAYLAGAFDLDRYAVNKADLYGQLEEARARQYAALQEETQRAAWAGSARELLSRGDLTAWLADADPNEANHVLRQLIERIVISPVKIVIELK